MSYYNRNSSSSSSVLPSSRKTHSEKHKQILKQLLKEHANKTCVDCKTATHPRWASWSLGCFMCIRCSGIHRSMGTHISKVKSVDLDAWTDEQVELMIKWGNEKCNIYWESKLPDGYVPDQLKIDNFIRTKYDLKKWASSTTIPNPLSIKASGCQNAGLTTAQHTSESHKSKNSDLGSADLLSGHSSKIEPHGSLLDDDFGSFTSSPSPKASTPVTSTRNTTALKSNQQRSNPTTQHKLPTQNTSDGAGIQSAQSTGGSFSNTRPDLKKSILSLYSSPKSSSSSFIQPQHNSQAQPNMQASVNSLSNSLSGLDFNNSNTSTNFNTVSSIPSRTSLASQSTSQQSHARPEAQTTNWTNEWTDSNGSTASLNNQWPNSGSSGTYGAPAKTTSLNSTNLDDDLFKNVWS